MQTPSLPDWQTALAPVSYPDALAFMESRVAAIAAGQEPDLIWLLEHPPIYTAGTSAKPDDLLVTPAQAGVQDQENKNGPQLALGLQRIPVYATGRGGQYTYHGPGQRVAYTLLNLAHYYPKPDIRAFVHDLEEWIIRTLAALGITGERRAGRIGIWVVDPQTGAENKIAALGIRVRRGVAYHGISINVNPDLSHFAGIVPCGISEHGVTSLAKLGVPASLADVDVALKTAFSDVFGGILSHNADFSCNFPLSRDVIKG